MGKRHKIFVTPTTALREEGLIIVRPPFQGGRMVSVPLFRIPIMAVSMALGQYFGGSAVAAASMMVEALAPPVIVPRRIKRYANSSPLPPCSTVLQAAATSEQQAADAVSPTPPSSLLRSVTFCNLPKDQGPPDMLCDF